ncbi:hypothetical protein ABVT39_021899 [Epinephelus coioides]
MPDTDWCTLWACVRPGSSPENERPPWLKCAMTVSCRRSGADLSFEAAEQ